MATKAVRYIILSQLSFFAFLAVCTILRPTYLLEHDEGGISNYGTVKLTIVPFSLACIVCGFYILRSAQFLPQTLPHYRPLKRILSILGMALFVILLSTYPYKTDTVLTDMHIALGMALFVFELAVATWLTLSVARNRWNIALLAVQITGLALSLGSIIGVLHILFIDQLISELAFGLLLIRNVAMLIKASEETT